MVEQSVVIGLIFDDMKLIESRVIKASGEKDFAVFDSTEIGGQTYLVLDKGNGRDILPEYFHPESSLLKYGSGGEVRCHHVGLPIEVGKYQDLPRERRGFYFSDGESVK
jgi:hypothetical protein